MRLLNFAWTAFCYLFHCHRWTHQPAHHFEPIICWYLYVLASGLYQKIIVSAGWVAEPNLSFLSTFRTVGHGIITCIMISSPCLLPHMPQAFSSSLDLSLPCAVCFFWSCPGQIPCPLFLTSSSVVPYIISLRLIPLIALPVIPDSVS